MSLYSAEHRSLYALFWCLTNSCLYVIAFSCHLEAVSELWAALGCVGAVVVPLAFLCCVKDRRQSGRASVL